MGPQRWRRAARDVAENLRRTARASEEQLRIAKKTNRTSDRLADAVVASTKQTRAQVKALSDTVAKQQALLEKLLDQSEALGAEVKTLRVAATASMMREVHEFTTAHQLTYRQTLDALARDEVSFARFGDGELRLLTDPMYRLGFQRNSAELRESLLRTLQSESSDELLIGWPRAFWTTHNTTAWSVVWDAVKELVPTDARFGNSHVSRPDCFQDLGQEAVELWRRVWEGRRVTIITGEGSRFEMVPELFDNIESSDFIYSTPRHAYDDLERIEKEVVQQPRSDLYLLSLGPAGTILAARLAARGVRAIDIGHISNSYRFVFDGANYPESLPGTRRRR